MKVIKQLYSVNTESPKHIIKHNKMTQKNAYSMTWSII